MLSRSTNRDYLLKEKNHLSLQIMNCAFCEIHKIYMSPTVRPAWRSSNVCIALVLSAAVFFCCLSD